MSYKDHAMVEFRAAGWVDENGKFYDEMQESICNHVLKLLDVFGEEGHSGSSAPYAVGLFEKLAMWKPIVPLTGEDWEWNEVSEQDGTLYQNKRCSAVFKDDAGAYYIDGIVFWEWGRRDLLPDEEGYPGTDTYKCYYTCRDSRVPVTFPYTPETKYQYRYSDAEPSAPKQTEEGIIE